MFSLYRTGFQFCHTMVAPKSTQKPRIPEEQLRQIGRVLSDPKRPLKERFRALFTLKNLGEVARFVSSKPILDPSHGTFRSSRLGSALMKPSILSQRAAFHT